MFIVLRISSRFIFSTLILQFTSSPLKNKRNKKVLFPIRAILIKHSFFFASCWRDLIERQETANWHFCFLIGESCRLSFFNANSFLPLLFWTILALFYKHHHLTRNGWGTSLFAQKRSRRAHRVNWWTSRSVYFRRFHSALLRCCRVSFGSSKFLSRVMRWNGVDASSR